MRMIRVWISETESPSPSPEWLWCRTAQEALDVLTLHFNRNPILVHFTDCEESVVLADVLASLMKFGAIDEIAWESDGEEVEHILGGYRSE